MKTYLNASTFFVFLALVAGIMLGYAFSPGQMSQPAKLWPYSGPRYALLRYDAGLICADSALIQGGGSQGFIESVQRQWHRDVDRYWKDDFALGENGIAAPDYPEMADHVCPS